MLALQTKEKISKLATLPFRFIGSPRIDHASAFNVNPLLSQSEDSNSWPFFWAEYSNLISDDLHIELRNEFPDITLFEKHVGLERGPADAPQRPHDRYYLALNWGPYSSSNKTQRGAGIIKTKALSKSWRSFVRSLEGGAYRKAIARILGTSRFKMRFAWHMGFSGAEICPHVDAPSKLGTHIFYFNRSDDWDRSWGGETVMLKGLKKPVGNPEFSDFSDFYNVQNIGNKSVLWKNSNVSWHGVKPLDAPPEMYRKIFTVVFDSR
jgi:hypothetical protein